MIPNFLEYIYKGVADRKTNYARLGSFTKLLRHLPVLLEPEDEEEIIQNLLESKKPTAIACGEIEEFYDLMAERGVRVPKSLHQHI